MKQTAILGWASVVALVAMGCTDEGEADTTGTSGPGVGGGATTSSSGGGGAGQGGGATGGGGAAPMPCLGADASADVFGIARTDLCVVAVYDAPALELAAYGTTPTWGTHGGPLTYDADPSTATIYRWTIAGASLTATPEDVTLSGIPADAYFGPQVIDPSGAPIFSWTGASFMTAGGIVVDDLGTGASTTTIGVFGLASGPTLRFYFTGLGKMGAAAGSTGLFAGKVIETPRAISIADDGAIDAWGLASGPVTLDSDANAFAIQTDYNAGTQEVRAFAADDIGVGDPAVVGTPLATLSGSGDAMAAMAPAGAAPGLVLLQPNDATTFAHGDVVAIEYVENGSAIAPQGTPGPALTLTTADTNLTLMTDPDGRLWVGATNPAGGSTFYVIRRK
jgi:hypothetical protein